MIKLKPKLNIDWCQHGTLKNDESINPHAFNIISVTKINYFKRVACPWINSAVSAVAKNPPTDGGRQTDSRRQMLTHGGRTTLTGLDK